MHTLKWLLAAALGTRLPITEGTIQLAGIRSKILIRRDENGIPYVEAENDDDAFFGAGFCQTQDRGFQMELYLRVARGTLAEVLGDEMLPVDRLMRRLGFVGIARRQLPLLAPRERAQLESFARGVNTATKLGAEKRPHELTLLGAKASVFDPLDIIAVLQFFAFALSSNWDAELARLRILRSDGIDALLALEASDPAWTRGIGELGGLADDAGALAAAERLADEASRLARLVGLGGASNAWAVAPSRTASGARSSRAIPTSRRRCHHLGISSMSARPRGR